MNSITSVKIFPNNALKMICLSLPMNETSVNRRVCKQWDALIKGDAFQTEVEKIAIRGELHITLSHCYINSYPKNSSQVTLFKWQSNDQEPHVLVTAYNRESIAECQMKHKEDDGYCSSIGYQGSWRDRYSRVVDFPMWMPLRLLINKFPKEGTTCVSEIIDRTLMPYRSQKVIGRLDQDIIKIMIQYIGLRSNLVHLVIKGQPAVLQCIDPDDYIDTERFTCWQKGLERRIDIGFVCRHLTEWEVAKARTDADEHDKKTALAVRHRWIFSG